MLLFCSPDAFPMLSDVSLLNIVFLYVFFLLVPFFVFDASCFFVFVVCLMLFRCLSYVFPLLFLKGFNPWPPNPGVPPEVLYGNYNMFKLEMVVLLYTTINFNRNSARPRNPGRGLNPLAGDETHSP